MSFTQLRDGFSVARSLARDRIENAVDLKKLFRVIDGDPAIVGAGVVYIDSEFNVVTLREFQPICSVAVKRVILRESPRYLGGYEFARTLEMQPRESELVAEVAGMVVACTGAIISWSVIGTTGMVLIPFSAGASIVVAYIGLAAGLATTAQCFNGAYKTHLEVRDPLYKDDLNSQAWYEAAQYVLDAVSLVGVAVTTGVTFKLIGLTKSSTGRSTRQALSSLNRQERRNLTKELLLIKDPRITPKLLKLRQAAGELPKRFTPVQIKHSTNIQIADCLSTIPDMVGSMMSGILRAVAVGIYQEFTGE
ncbi:NAD synthetase [Pseudomonas sp. ICMP 561]|uniref:NAD synthetase n=1 Tax=Pseudomonas sp. ICMP 561 TaxID=1718918 RepID=UPI000C070391|nr:NAD synthetase [Pseudomonas sp. ICMP 561]PHN32290.1 NAD synthetase [Pseudomonas sp. ICMP 561]